MRILVKIGSAQLADPQARRDLATAIATARFEGHQVILVHGGGDQIRALSRRLGLQDHYHEGLRITDRDTAEVALWVLGGGVNRELVAALQEMGVRATGLTGADGGTFTARRHTPDGHDLGYVGRVHETDPTLVDALLELGVVPVLATVAPLAEHAPGPRDRFYNINADHACGPLARAFRVEAVVFLTDVPGVLDDNGVLFSQLDAETCAALRESGVIHGGMIPKVQAALEALDAHPGGQVKIAPAAGTNALLHAMASGVGTLFVSPAPQGQDNHDG